LEYLAQWKLVSDLARVYYNDSMSIRSEKLENLLKLEVMDKSFASSLTFAAFAVFAFFYKFNCVRFSSVIEITSVIMMIVNLIRFAFCLKVNKSKKIEQREWRILQIMIWVNAVGWSIILNLSSFELKLQGPHFIVVTTIIAGFIGSSIVTLSYFPSLFIPFQLLLLVPQIFIITFFYFSEGVNLLPMIFLYVMYLIYQLKQYQVYRRENLKRFTYQLDLELANEQLKNSKNELIDQTVKLVHVSRLAALGEMSAGIAHEINNPLTIIKGGAQLIEKSLSKEPADLDMIFKQAQKIQNSVSRVTKIVQGLKSFSNLSDNKPKENISLKEVIDDTLNFCTEALNSNNIKLEIDVIPDCKMFCHPVQISQVLINIIKNAQDEINERNLKQPERWVQLKFEINNHMLSIKIINGGQKLDDELLNKIFSPFFTTKPVGKGTGLGLSISQKIMREHLGDISIDHQMPNTTFIVTHPVL
jgi:signal transduction histidine kinase